MNLIHLFRFFIGINKNGQYITHLWFADDIVVMAETIADLSTMLDYLRQSFKINMAKLNLRSVREVTQNVLVPNTTVCQDKSL